MKMLSRGKRISVPFLNGLSESEILKLFDFIDLQPFPLDEEKLKDIITSIKSPADKKLLNAGLKHRIHHPKRHLHVLLVKLLLVEQHPQEPLNYI